VCGGIRAVSDKIICRWVGKEGSTRGTQVVFRGLQYSAGLCGDCRWGLGWGHRRVSRRGGKVEEGR
jgi:hypothetical protein